jgi:sphingomyelin phosphodiesterase
MFEYITEEIKPDGVFWAGDSISHNLDSLTFKSNVDNMVRVSSAVNDAFKGIPLWAAIGNHDTYPQDIFKGHHPYENLAINRWSKSWRVFDFLDDPEQRRHFEEYGFYSAPFVNKNGTDLGNKKTRVVHINSNFCY